MAEFPHRVVDKLMVHIWQNTKDHYAGNERDTYDELMEVFKDHPELVEWLETSKGYAGRLPSGWPSEFEE